MTDQSLVLPTPDALAAERDPSKRLIALVEPATNMLVRATALDEVNQIRGQAEAIERYARTIRLSTEAVGAAQIIARRAEVRIGELTGPSLRGSKPGGAKRGVRMYEDHLTGGQRHEYRRMADNVPTVEEVLGELAPQGKAHRSAVLERIRRQKIHEAGEPGRRLVDQTPVAELLEVKRAIRLAITRLERLQSYGQTVSSPPLARDVKELCRQLGEML